MPDVMTINKVVQCGIEVTPGTQVVATKALKMATLDTGADLTFNIFPGMGRRFDVATALNQDMTLAKLGGPFNYTEMVYWLSAIYGTPAITIPTGATLARQWLWNVPLTGSIVPKTLTVEEGDTIQAHKFGYGMLSDIGGKFVRDGECQAEGAVFGQISTDGITLTGALSGVPQIPVLGKHLSYYLDTTFAGIGVTKYLRVFDCQWKWGKAFSQAWPMDRSQTSFAAHVDTDPDTEVVLVVANDTQGVALRAAARANQTQYLRIEAIGDQIETGTPNQFYLLNIDMPMRIVKIDPYADHKGIYAYGVKLRVIEDATFGQGATIRLVNTQVAL